MVKPNSRPLTSGMGREGMAMVVVKEIKNPSERNS
jgi:hypothetical protein